MIVTFQKAIDRCLSSKLVGSRQGCIVEKKKTWNTGIMPDRGIGSRVWIEVT